MTKSYVNAARVLPQELLEELRRHCVGLVYVPVRDDFKKRRAALVARLGDLGVPAREIAALCGLTRRRVQQILKEHAEAAKKGEKVSIDNRDVSV
ncbi:MAG TPA: helix-turn-helix domain-containing protein [Planctomycetota bacterium]|nr:helix-turn-helix domain-containing protein [Planctomycetota bacterium]